MTLLQHRWQRLAHTGAVAALLPAAVFVTTPAAAQTFASPPAAPSVERIFVGPLERTFNVYAPASNANGELRSVRPALVLALHGAGGDGRRLRHFTSGTLERLADEHGFIVIYPDGLGGHWNDCRAASPYPARKRRIDDISFVRALIRWAEGRYDIDPRKVHAFGFSNGGHFAIRLALEMPDEIAAVAAVGASLPVPDELDCTIPDRTAPVMLVNGTADSINPYAGGSAKAPDGEPLGRVRSADESARELARIAGHGAAPDRTIPLARADGTGVQRLHWRQHGTSDVILITILGGGHTIPGSSARFPDIVGPVERAYDAVRDIVRFFMDVTATR